jgi:hypothetical protein
VVREPVEACVGMVLKADFGESVALVASRVRAARMHLGGVSMEVGVSTGGRKKRSSRRRKQLLAFVQRGGGLP